MTVTEQDRIDDAPTEPDSPTASRVFYWLGGVKGIVYSTIPVIVFAVANALLSLPLTIAVSIGAGLALTLFRILRGERIVSALGSVIGVAATAGTVAWTGSARDFFALGIWVSLAGFIVTAGSVLARRPLSGIIWNVVHGGKHTWRTDRAVLRAHDLTTSLAALVLGARFTVQQFLYVADSTGGLSVTRIVMGVPLTVVVAFVVVWAFRRSSARLVRTT